MVSVSCNLVWHILYKYLLIQIFQLTMLKHSPNSYFFKCNFPIILPVMPFIWVCSNFVSVKLYPTIIIYRSDRQQVNTRRMNPSGMNWFKIADKIYNRVVVRILGNMVSFTNCLAFNPVTFWDINRRNVMPMISSQIIMT